MVRIVATSDLHGHLPTKIPDCDLLLIAGDIVPTGLNNVGEASWLNQNFLQWTKDKPQIVMCAGNHDFVYQDAPHLLRSELRSDSGKIIYLQDKMVEIEGLSIYGSPWTETFYDWAFMLNRNALEHRFNNIPKADIYVIHSPPFGFGDFVGKEHTGSIALLRTIQRNQPKLTVFGHIHHGHGTYHVNKSIVANVSYCKIKGQRYVPGYPVEVFDV